MMGQIVARAYLGLVEDLCEEAGRVCLDPHSVASAPVLPAASARILRGTLDQDAPRYGHVARRALHERCQRARFHILENRWNAEESVEYPCRRLRGIVEEGKAAEHLRGQR
jgi:hypothetical protein